MITEAEITLVSNPEGQEAEGVFVAFAIDSEVVHLMGTYTWFLNFFDGSYVIEEDLEAPANTHRVLFKQDGEVKETLECSEMISALLRSNPKIITLVSEPKPPIEEIGLLRYVQVGWPVDENGQISPPPGWTQPVTVYNLTEEQKNKLREQGWKI